jgi:hypothetical protein
MMPQPFKPNCALDAYHFGIVTEHPKHAIGIAWVASEWAALEVDLILVFTHALFVVAPLEQGSRARSGKSVGRNG